MEPRNHLLRLLCAQYREGDFTLSSGRKSSYYLDCRPVTFGADGISLVGRAFLSKLERGPQVQAVGGPALGAAPIVMAVASIVSMLRASYMQIRYDSFLVRKELKGHGTGQWVEGPELKVGTPVAILEDVLTSGASALHAITKVREAGLVPVRMVVLVDRQEGGSEALRGHVELVESIYTISEIQEAHRGKS